MKSFRLTRWAAVVGVLSLVLAACAETDGENTDEVPAEGSNETAASGNDDPDAVEGSDPWQVGWLTDASAFMRGTYFPEYDGARLYFERLNSEGGVHGRPIELTMEDIQVDPERAVAGATRMIEGEGVIALAGGTVEALQPSIYEVATSNQTPYISGFSARPNMYPPDPDEYLFTAGSVFHAAADARVTNFRRLFDELYPDGGLVSCYGHESPAVFVSCGRWMEQMEEDSDGTWEQGTIYTAPLDTSDFTSYAEPLASEQPDAMLVYTLASHALGFANAARDAGYEGHFVFAIPAQSEPVIEEIVGSIGGDRIAAESHTAVIYEDVPGMEAIRDAWNEYGGEIELAASHGTGWLIAKAIAEGLDRCGPGCDREGLRDALEETNVDTEGLWGGPLVWTESDHSGPRYWLMYEWSEDEEALVRGSDWFEFAPDDLLRPIEDN